MRVEGVSPDILAFTLNSDNVAVSPQQVRDQAYGLRASIVRSELGAPALTDEEGNRLPNWDAVAEPMLEVAGSRAGRGAIALVMNQKGDDYRNGVVGSDSGGYLIAALADNRCVAQAEDWINRAGPRYFDSRSAANGIAALGTFSRISKYVVLDESDPALKDADEAERERRAEEIESNRTRLLASPTAGVLVSALISKDPAESDKPLGLQLMRDYAGLYMPTEYASLGIGTLGASLRAYTTMVEVMRPHMRVLSQQKGVRLPVNIALSTPMTSNEMVSILKDPIVAGNLVRSGAAADINKKIQREGIDFRIK